MSDKKYLDLDGLTHYDSKIKAYGGDHYAGKTTVFSEGVPGLVPGPDAATIAAGKILSASGAWVDAGTAGGLVKADITTGSTNGSIAVQGTDVPVKGLGTAAYKADTYFQAAEAGKGLSTNDFTTEYQTKLTNISTGATKVEASTTNGNIKVDGAETTVYTHPEATGHASGLYKITVDGTGHVSGATAVVKGDITALGIPAQDTTYSVATSSVAGLMSAADRTKLDGVAADANNYVHPTHDAASAGLYKVTVDTLGHVSAAVSVEKSDITALGIPAQDTTYTAASGTTDGLMTIAMFNKLGNVEAGANNYVHPSFTAVDTGLYKVKVDNEGHVSTTSNVLKSDITGLGIPAQDTTYSDATTTVAGLMSTADKTKLDGVAANANNYVHPNSFTAKTTEAVYKFTVDANGHVTAGDSVVIPSSDNLVPNTRKVAGEALSADISAASLKTALDLGTAAYTEASAYATAGQGTKADSALQTTDITNNVTSTATNKALSANMGKELQDQINNLKARGRFLSVWNCTTGKPGTDPTDLPYTYHTGDYFIVGTTGATNYRPNGNQYTGAASTTQETSTVNTGDTYYYDGTAWGLQSNTGGSVTFQQVTGDPMDNTNLAAAFNGKSDTTHAHGNITSDGKVGTDPNKLVVTGTSGLVSAGTVAATGLAAGSTPTATLAGGVLTFGIPAGAKGDPGNPGAKGDTGDTGDAGAAAGFGTPTATVDANVGTPSVTITATGPDTAKVFSFDFKNLKGVKGDPGDPGTNGADGAPGATGATGPAGTGISAITTSSITGGTRVSISLTSGGDPTTFDVMNGTNGTNGADGQDGQQGIQGPAGPNFTVTGSTGTGKIVCIPTAGTSATNEFANTAIDVDGGNLTTTGTITAYSFNATSLRERKENIEKFEKDAVSLINDIEVVSFNFKEDEDRNYKVGFIADDTNEIFATKNHDCMDLYNTVGVLLKAVQQLSKENKELRKEIEAIKG